MLLICSAVCLQTSALRLSRGWASFVGVAMGLAAASSAFLFAKEAAASPGDEPAPQRPQDIVRKATKHDGMMGFLKPMTDADKLANRVVRNGPYWVENPYRFRSGRKNETERPKRISVEPGVLLYCTRILMI